MPHRTRQNTQFLQQARRFESDRDKKHCLLRQLCGLHKLQPVYAVLPENTVVANWETESRNQVTVASRRESQGSVANGIQLHSRQGNLQDKHACQEIEEGAACPRIAQQVGRASLLYG